MRKAFIDTLIKLAESDKDIWLLTADMGFGLVEPFVEKFPDRFINVGVSEQNMIGIATGLALEGKKVFCYSIACFPTMRCLEQIRNDICYHNLPVCIVSGGAGLWYGALGMTHHALEDIAVMRSLPNMAVVSPRDAVETAELIKLIYDRNSPSYLRMTRTSNSVSNTACGRTHPDVAIISTGGMMYASALSASQQLDERQVRSLVYHISTIKPLSPVLIQDIVRGTKLVVTIEEHSKIGGLGSTVAEILAGLRQHPPLVRMGTDDCYQTTAMSYEELLVYNRLTADNIVKEVLDAIE